MEQGRAFSLIEVMKLGFEACHISRDGSWWLFHGICAFRYDPVSDVRTLVVDLGAVPDGPWLPTAWGELELEDGEGAAV